MRDFHTPGRSAVLACNAMVATSHPLAASEALNVLRSGGNAADAAIAGAVLLGVCEPHMTSIGGDCFALIKPAGSNKVISLNGSGRAPAAISADALRDEGISKIIPGHPASITIPGAVDGFCQLSEAHGRIGLDRCLAPAIRHFEAGVPVASRVAQHTDGHSGPMTAAAKQHYFRDGQPYRLGEKFCLPGQAEVLRRVAKHGRSAFYEGEIADDILSALSEIGGVHNDTDLANTDATWGTPIHGPAFGHDLIEHPPNGQGAVALLIARILEEFDLSSLDPSGMERVHLLAEATKLAYDARNRFVADLDYVQRLEHMLAPQTAKALAGLIDPRRAMAAPAPLTEDVHKDTVLITTVDSDGMAVSLIYSIFANFGSGVASPKFGILLHNRGSGFNLTPGHPNEIGPGKRPMHTIIPAMRASGGSVDMTFGVMGGQYQAAGHAQFLSNLSVYGLDLQEAIDAPRSFADPISGNLQLERGIPDATKQALANLGHKVTVPENPIGGAQAILIDQARGVLTGASDPRKDGLAIGY